ncbi:UxaA family hydrolase [Clostridium sporogenes]
MVKVNFGMALAIYKSEKIKKVIGGMDMLKLAVVANANDNVATAVKDLKKGEKVLIDLFGKDIEVMLNEDIPFGHKFAIKDIQNGEEIIKYKESIGQATQDIKVGDYVHVHNVVSERGRGDLEVSK